MDLNGKNEELTDLVSQYTEALDELGDNKGDLVINLVNDLFKLLGGGPVLSRAPEQAAAADERHRHIVTMQDADSLIEEFGNLQDDMASIFGQLIEDREFLIEQHRKMKEYIDSQE